MKILAVVPFSPYPPDQGDRMRAWDMLEALSDVGDLTVWIVSSKRVAEDSLRALRRIAQTVNVHRLTFSHVAWALASSAVVGGPIAVTQSWSESARRRIASDQDAPWDVACAFQLRTAPYVVHLAAGITVLEMTDALGLYRRRLPLRGRSLLHWLSLRGIDELERRMPSMFHRVWISAEADAQWIENLSSRRPQVVPNGCRAVTVPAPFRGDGPLLFVGNMRYPPNEDAVVWFARYVWPKLASTRVGAVLRIVGRTTPRVRRLARQPGIEVAGYVPDASLEVASAAVVINPVRFGSGSSRKVLDAWASGRPVVSTTIGVRGLGCRDGVDVLLADTTEAWCEKLTWLMDNPNAARELGLRGWNLALRTYDTSAIWRKALTDLVEGRRSPG